MPIPFLPCMALAASFYQLPPRVLPSIHAVEGGAVGSVHVNTDGSEDLGFMQVNTRWVLSLARLAKMTARDVRDRLIGDPCFNIAAAAAIMRTYLVEARGRSHARCRRLPFAHATAQSTIPSTSVALGVDPIWEP